MTFASLRCVLRQWLGGGTVKDLSSENKWILSHANKFLNDIYVNIWLFKITLIISKSHLVVQRFDQLRNYRDHWKLNQGELRAQSGEYDLFHGVDSCNLWWTTQTLERMT